MTPIALDIIISMIVLLSVMVSYSRGLIKEGTLLGGFFLAAYMAYKCGALLVPGLNDLLHVGDPDKDAGRKILNILTPEMAAKVGAYGGTFILTFIMITLLGHMMTSWMRAAGIGIVDKALGGVFGFLRGFLIIFLLYVAFTFAVKDHNNLPDWAKESFSVAVLQKSVDNIKEYFDLNKNIQEDSDGVTIKIKKINIDELTNDAKEKVNDAEQQLKDAVRKEEKNIQKGDTSEGEDVPSFDEDEGESTAPDGSNAPANP